LQDQFELKELKEISSSSNSLKGNFCFVQLGHSQILVSFLRLASWLGVRFEHFLCIKCLQEGHGIELLTVLGFLIMFVQTEQL